MKEEFSKYDKVVYDGDVFEVLETADRTGMMKLGPLFKASYEHVWANEEMVVSLNRAIKLRLIDEERLISLRIIALSARIYVIPMSGKRQIRRS